MFRNRHHHRRIRGLILGLALLLGQWMSVAHGLDHPVTGDRLCTICLHAQGLDTGAVPLSWTGTVPVPKAAAPVLARIPSAPRALWRSPVRVRGPPLEA